MKDKEWVDSQDDIETIDKVYNYPEHNHGKKCMAWLKVLPQIGRALGFKLQEHNYIWSPSDTRYPDEEKTSYRVVRKDLSERVRDQLAARIQQDLDND